ncbi:MAG: hypothetical protein EZS28_041844, partial [Streblomastix strix]
ESGLPRDDRGYIIWPLEGSTQLPFFVKATVINSQNAIFSLNDYSWLNSRLKWYGIFASNDGVNFAGIDGNNESVRLDVIIEEGEQFVNYLRFQLSAWQAWLIPPIVVGFLTLIISGIVYKLWNDRYEKNKEAEHMKLLIQQRDHRQVQQLNTINRLIQRHYEQNSQQLVPVIEDESIPSDGSVIDYSLVALDSDEATGQEWGPTGPPASMGLAQHGIYQPPKEILELQMRQNKVNKWLEQKKILQ